MNRALSFFALYAISSVNYLLAQSDICIGKCDSIYSQALNEERIYWVHLPESYEDSIQKQYPVIYLLDGDLFFHALVAVQRSYAHGRQPMMPECIIIGILNTDRTRDLTPSLSAYRRDGTRYDGDREVGGGSEAFTIYLCNELRNKINTTYRTNNNNSIIGHSFGGLFVLNTLMYHFESFNAYIALDPSLWWDNGKLTKEADNLLDTKKFNNTKLYIGIARKMPSDVNNIHLSVVDNFINKILPKAVEQGLHANLKIFPEESHGTIPISGMLDALKIMLQ
jgi:predicted alpha/beta superfamily hydrolase